VGSCAVISKPVLVGRGQKAIWTFQQVASLSSVGRKLVIGPMMSMAVLPGKVLLNVLLKSSIARKWRPAGFTTGDMQGLYPVL